jgi:guanylate kinase
MRFTSKNAPILVIIGPSGAGKSTIIRKLYDRGLVLINPTWTTRPPRPKETNEGIEHKFVSNSEFSKKQAADYFLKVVELFGLPYRYGVPEILPTTPEQVSLIMLRAPLITLLNKHYPVHIIYQIEDELPKIRERLIARQQHGEDMGTRLEDYEKEIVAGRKLAKRTFVNNKEPEQIAKQVEQAILEDFAK